MRLFGVRLIGLLIVFPFYTASAQNWGSVRGSVSEHPSGLPLAGVTVVVDGTNFGTATDAAGHYALSLPDGRYVLRFSSVGFEPRHDSVTVHSGHATTLDVSLIPLRIELENVTVEGTREASDAGVYEIEPETIRDMPTPFRDVLRSLKVVPGVATNNELSNQYSVRGGGFNENLLFLNGYEVYLPFRPRQAEQEGLSLLNPDLTDRVTFYTGGFPARYGGKLSSALEVRYHRPENEPLHGSVYASLLDAGVSAGASALNGRLGWVAGFRKAQAYRFFSTQELKGSYQPDYTDLQASLSYRFAPGHEVEALGIWAEHRFLLDPSTRKTYFGTVSLDPRTQSNLQSLWTTYDDASREEDGYATRFAGIRLSNRLSGPLRIEHDVSLFETSEEEYYDLSGTAILFEVDPFSGSPQSGSGHVPVGNTRQHDRGDSRVDVLTLTGQGRWLLSLNRHAAEAGWFVRSLRFDDRLFETAEVTGRSSEGEHMRIVLDSLQDRATLDAVQGGFYVQDVVDVLPTRNKLVLVGGLRADYFSFNDEWTVSPRFSARYRLTDQTLLLGSLGVYYQPPSYRELRNRPRQGETLLGSLNRDIKSQRSVQVTAGVEHFLPRTRMYLRGEAYWKHLANLISYDIQNVRIRYSGRNDSRGYAYGLDLQLRGEFVPGQESWVNYSYMVARERFLPPYLNEYNTGLIPRPTDQRHTFSAFFQDYVPGDPTWKLHLRALFGSGLPYTPPAPGEKIGNVTLQRPGERFSARFIEYKRVDMGVTKSITVFERATEAPVRLQITGEVLNVFNMTNTVAYSWVPGSDGIWNRIPTRLTPRTLNVRLRLDF